MNHNIIHKISILLAAETEFRNFAMPKDNIGLFCASIDRFNGIKVYFEIFFVKIYFGFFWLDDTYSCAQKIYTQKGGSKL